MELFGVFLVYLFSLSCSFVEGNSSQDVQDSRDVKTESKIMNKPYYGMMVDKHKKNMTYIDIPDNSMHVPFPNGHPETKKKKTIKKSAKRTIQRIIKKGRAKRKYYMNYKTSSIMPSIVPEEVEESRSVRDEPTTQPPRSRKVKKTKWNNKVSRYPMPFQKLQKRTKRKMNEERDNVFILQDLDEIEFLDHKDGVNVVNAHVKKYW